MAGADSDWQRRIFRFFGRNALWLACSAVCVASYIGYARYGRELVPWFRDLLLHLATASFIAAALDVFFEYNFRVRYLEHWGSNVLRAVAGAMVPPSIVTEVVAILKSPIVRKECTYTLEFLPPPDGAANTFFLLRRDLSYTACNKLGRRTPFTVTSSLENVRNSPHTKHTKLKVNKREIIPLSVTREGEYSKLEYHHPKGLRPNQEMEVFTSGQELIEIGVKQNSYIIVLPCESLMVRPVNSYRQRIEKLSIRMHHPINEEIKPDDNNVFHFRHAILPGQGFDILWELKKQ